MPSETHDKGAGADFSVFFSRTTGRRPVNLERRTKSKNEKNAEWQRGGRGGGAWRRGNKQRRGIEASVTLALALANPHARRTRVCVAVSLSLQALAQGAKRQTSKARHSQLSWGRTVSQLVVPSP